MALTSTVPDARTVARNTKPDRDRAIDELVGVDVAAEDFDAPLPVRLEERSAGEADEDPVRQNGLHRLVQFARLRAVALVHEDEQLALSVAIVRKVLL